jgi:hypothetical protein
MKIPRVTEQLKQAGWFEGRAVDVDPLVSSLRSINCAAWPELLSMLTEYSGLVFCNRDRSRCVWIDPIQAVAYADAEWLRAYATFVGAELAPIGGYSHMAIYFGSDGTFYGSFDTAFGPLGKTIESLIDGVLNRMPPTQLTDVIEWPR